MVVPVALAAMVITAVTAAMVVPVGMVALAVTVVLAVLAATVALAVPVVTVVPAVPVPVPEDCTKALRFRRAFVLTRRVPIFYNMGEIIRKGDHHGYYH
jgi:hypothetical protein